MTPLRFEADHAAAWAELDAALAAFGAAPPASPGVPKAAASAPAAAPDPARVAALYRLACEHLALARARSYPVHLIERLESLTQAAHQAVYRHAELGLARLGRLFAVGFPQAVRRHHRYFWVAALVFFVPMIAVGIQCYVDPGFILTVHDAAGVARFDEMYGDDAGHVDRRSAGIDTMMFGHYVKNNISIAFQCYAGGLFLGVGSLVALAFNGAVGGSVAGYLTRQGHGANFYSFVVTHGAFELTAIVIAGSAGLMLGHALLAPGRRGRLRALQHAASESVVLIYGVVAMLVVAAGIEAFWSASRWIEPAVKVGVGALCWLAVAAYLAWQGRPPRRAPERR